VPSVLRALQFFVDGWGACGYCGVGIAPHLWRKTDRRAAQGIRDMVEKTYRARIINSTGSLDAGLERTHRMFVECVRQMLYGYIYMRKGKYGKEGKKLVRIILNRTNRFRGGVLDKLSRAGCVRKLTDEWIAFAG